MRERVISGVSSSVGVGENIGAHVSGGLDSSAVAVLANEKLSAEHGKIARAFSWSPPPTTSLETDDERVRTCELLDALDIPVSWTTLDASGLRDSMLRGLEPSAASGLVHEQWIAKSAVQAGVGVVLSGWGGDEFASFNGRGAIAGAVRQGRIAAAAAAAYSQAERGGRRGLLGAVSATRRLWGQGFAPLVPDLRRDHLPVGSPAAIYRDVLSKLHPSAAAMIRGETRWPQAGAAATQLALLENGHIEQRLASWSHLGDEHGIEYRYPLLDVELVEFCLTVPEDVHLRAPVDRWLFREAMSPWLPHEICWEQPKSEPAKFAAQLRVLADTPAVRPEGPAEAADIVERFFELRREFHTRLLAAS
jgi:asparagine synthase (glutamine-hydrolysing)